MYNIKNFGERLQTLRKAKNMTQEDLAHRLGVTGQAVSKWETNQSYPDITLLPAVAEILDTTISYLFGEQTPSHIADEVIYPPEHNGMKLVLSNSQAACYSNKSVKSTDNTGVVFEDGSTAELTTQIVINRGQGEITILPAPSKDYNYNAGHGGTHKTKQCEFGHSHSLSVQLLNANCKIVPSKDDKTRIFAQGSAEFIARLIVNYAADTNTLEVGYTQPEGNNNFYYRENDNKMEIELPIKPDDCGGHLKLFTNASGDIKCENLHFNTGELYINGSGNIGVPKFVSGSQIGINGSGDVSIGYSHDTRININGSGDVSLGAAHSLAININGSGDVHVGGLGMMSENATGDFSARINGSGDIGIGGGICNKFDADIMGSGDIAAGQLTAKTSHIVIHNSGIVHLGRVIESSTEQIKKNGEIKINQRG